MFGKIKLDDNQGEFEISRHNNFQNFGRSFLVLFRYIIFSFFLKNNNFKFEDFLLRAATGESWQDIMISITRQTKCDPESRPPKEERVPGEENCSSWVAVPYFISFVILCSFLVMK